jgi:hypothetical protein
MTREDSSVKAGRDVRVSSRASTKRRSRVMSPLDANRARARDGPRDETIALGR